MALRILNAEPLNYSPDARNIISEFAVLDEEQVNRSELVKMISDYDGLIVRLGHHLDNFFFERAKKLKTIATATTGLNHIDLVEAEKNNITVISLKGEREFLDTIYATAEHTWALLLALIRKLVPSARHVNECKWDRDLFRGNELAGRTLGIIGYGRLGSKVAGYGTAFGMNVLAYDTKEQVMPEGVKATSLETLLSNSDIITCHVPYHKSTEKIISYREFELMKSGCYLINTSRGEILDETLLLQHLKEKHLAGAALDVLCGEYEESPEWIKKHPLIKYAKNNDNLIITPHIGGATRDSMAKTEIFIAQKLRTFFT